MPVARSDAGGQSVGEEGLNYYSDAAGTATVAVSPTTPLPVSQYGSVTAGTASVIVKTATATASGDTAVWTPAGGKKFRLQKARIEITTDASLAAGADLDIVLRDATTATGVAMSVYVPTTAVTTNVGSYATGWVDLGTGLLSATINNVLNVNLSAALTSGKVRVVVAGTEE